MLPKEVYSLSRPRSCGHMSSLVGDSGQLLGVLDFDTVQVVHFESS